MVGFMSDLKYSVSSFGFCWFSVLLESDCPGFSGGRDIGLKLNALRKRRHIQRRRETIGLAKSI